MTLKRNKWKRQPATLEETFGKRAPGQELVSGPQRELRTPATNKQPVKTLATKVNRHCSQKEINGQDTGKQIHWQRSLKNNAD